MRNEANLQYFQYDLCILYYTVLAYSTYLPMLPVCSLLITYVSVDINDRGEMCDITNNIACSTDLVCQDNLCGKLRKINLIKVACSSTQLIPFGFLANPALSHP